MFESERDYSRESQGRTRGQGCNKDHFRYEEQLHPIYPARTGRGSSLRHYNITAERSGSQDVSRTQFMARNQMTGTIRCQVKFRVRVHKDYTHCGFKSVEISRYSTLSVMQPEQQCKLLDKHKTLYSLPGRMSSQIMVSPPALLSPTAHNIFQGSRSLIPTLPKASLCVAG